MYNFSERLEELDNILYNFGVFGLGKSTGDKGDWDIYLRKEQHKGDPSKDRWDKVTTVRNQEKPTKSDILNKYQMMKVKVISSTTAKVAKGSLKTIGGAATGALVGGLAGIAASKIGGKALLGAARKGVLKARRADLIKGDTARKLINSKALNSTRKAGATIGSIAGAAAGAASAFKNNMRPLNSSDIRILPAGSDID